MSGHVYTREKSHWKQYFTIKIMQLKHFIHFRVRNVVWRWILSVQFYLPHLALAAFLAISDRLLADNAFALAGPPLAPPFLPNATAAAFLPSGVNRVSWVSLVAISTMDFAFWFISVGRFFFAMTKYMIFLCLFGQAYSWIDKYKLKSSISHRSVVSIIISILTITALLLINWDIAKTYVAADGKTRALFGITLMINFWYQYLFIVPGIISIIISITALKNGRTGWVTYIALILSVISVVSVFIDFWKIMIWAQ